MKNLNIYNEFRVRTPEAEQNLEMGNISYFENNGSFAFPGEKGEYHVAVGELMGWQHVSMVVETVYNGKKVTRIPGTSELEEVKNMIFGDEVVIEVHPTKDEYVNVDPYKLHLWRPIDKTLPLPPVVEEFVEEDFISIPGSDISLLVNTARRDGWECYEVSVIKDGKKVRRKPSWDEMCVAKKTICGEEAVALQYHIKNDGTGAYSIRLWVPPKTLDMPLPKPYMVGFRNEEDMEACIMHLLREKIW